MDGVTASFGLCRGFRSSLRHGFDDRSFRGACGDFVFNRCGGLGLGLGPDLSLGFRLFRHGRSYRLRLAFNGSFEYGNGLNRRGIQRCGGLLDFRLRRGCNDQERRRCDSIEHLAAIRGDIRDAVALAATITITVATATTPAASAAATAFIAATVITCGKRRRVVSRFDDLET